MINGLVIGSASEIGSRIVLGLIERNVSVTAVSRSKLNPDLLNAIKANKNQSIHNLVDSYLDLKIDKDYKYIFFTTGIFNHSRLVDTTELEISKEINQNISEPIQLTKRILDINGIDAISNKYFVYIGSTAAYQGFSNMSTYCASKFALRGFVQSMNDEYANSGNRFSLVSMGTMNTKMGRKYSESIGRKISSLIDPGYIANRILDSIFNIDDILEPEMIFRYRNSKN